MNRLPVLVRQHIAAFRALLVLTVICGLIYNEADGWPDDGIAPGTRWADIPDDWMCPDCGAEKSDFQMVET